MKRKIYRNGDYSFIPLSSKDTVVGEKCDTKTSFTFAEGEATGHYHTATVEKLGDMQFFKLPNGEWVVEFKSNATITHPEHSLKNDLVVPAGKYLVSRRREKDWFSLATRKIVD